MTDLVGVVSCTRYKMERSRLEKLPLEMFDDADEYETHSPEVRNDTEDRRPGSRSRISNARACVYVYVYVSKCACYFPSFFLACSCLFLVLASLQEWLKLGPEEGKARTTGRSLFFIHNRFLWLPCEIVEYDATTEEYIVEFLSEDDLRGRPDLAHVVDDLLQTLGDIAIPKLTIAKDKTVVEPVWPNTDPILLPNR